MKFARIAAAAVVLSQLAMPVMAEQPTDQPTETTLTPEQQDALRKEADTIKTVDDYVHAYFSVKEEKTDDQGQPMEPVYTTYVFSQLDDQQYESVLKGEQIFPYLSEELQKNIQDWFKAYTEDNPEDENHPLVHELSDWFTKAKEVKAEVERKKAEEAAAASEQPAEQPSETYSSRSLEAPVEQPARAALIEADSQPARAALLETESQPAERLAQPSAESTTPVERFVQPETTTTVERVARAAQLGDTEQAFIRSYATNEAGVVYTDVNSANYRKILSGLNTWTSLTKTQKAAINNQLKEQGGLTYSQMLSLAQSYQYGRKPLAVQTSLKDDAPLYRLMVGGSLIGFLYVSAQIKRKDA